MPTKWLDTVLDVLKASGWKTAGIAVGSYILIYLHVRKRLFVPLDSWAVQSLEVACALCACVSASSVASASFEALKPIKTRVLRRFSIGREKRAIEASIPQLTVKEREILGYLARANQRHFTNTADGGYAATLISKGFVVPAARPGQVCTPLDIPFEIPQHVWEVLNQHQRKCFVYTRRRETISLARVSMGRMKRNLISE